MANMQSIEKLRYALIDSGYTTVGADSCINAITTHACVCRTRADTRPGIFRDFVSCACEMTRDDYRMSNLRSDMSDGSYPEIAAAASDVLFDLIMEGV